MFIKGLQDAATILTNDLVFQEAPMVPRHFKPHLIETDIYKSSFSPQTVIDWNSLAASLIFAAGLRC